MAATVSVVIPTCNGAAFLKDAFQSLLNQTLPPQEVIIVDDASTDGTCAVATAIVGESPFPVRVIPLSRNSGGPARPLNVGIGAASSEFIAVLDQDDRFCPTKLQAQATLLANEPGLSFVFSLCSFVHEPKSVALIPGIVNPLLAHSVPAAGYRHLPGKMALRLFMEHGNYVWGYPGFLFRKAAWQRKGGLEEGLKIGSDYEFLCWLCGAGDVGFIPEIQYLRREHTGNMCNRVLAMNLEVVRIQARYLNDQKWLRKIPTVFLRTQDYFLYIAHLAKEEGRFGQAFRCCLLSLQVHGWRKAHRRAMASLLRKLLRDSVRPRRD